MRPLALAGVGLNLVSVGFHLAGVGFYLAGDCGLFLGRPLVTIICASTYFRIAWVGEYPDFTAVNLTPANRVTAKRISVKGDSAKGNDTLPLYRRHE